MIRRPKPGEDENDILRMQEEFLEDKSFQPSAQVINLRKTDHQTTKRTTATISDTRKLSKYANYKGLTKEKRPRIDTSAASVLGAIVEKNLVEEQEASEPDDDKVYYPRVIPSVLGHIVEKSFDGEYDFDFKTTHSNGFPVIPKRDTNIKSGLKSIFAQEREKTIQHKDNEMDIDQQSSSLLISCEKGRSLNIPLRSYILSCNDADDIHKENSEILSTMSEQDILQEQQKLHSTLKPELIDFIGAKRNKSICTNNVQTINMETNVAGESSATEPQLDDTVSNSKAIDYLWENDVLLHPEINKWLHFENFEKDKLEWIKGVEDCKMLNPNEPYEARFDFKGYLLPYTTEYTEKTKTLYHHGEESHRPGYSVTEVMELTRSTVTQQRVMALNIIGGILEYYTAGLYKDVIEIPLSKIFFVMRIAMDENKLILLEPALRAMRNLLYNKLDEACLDSLLGFEEGISQPCLENDKSEIEEMDTKETELNDFYLAEIDLISTVMRTDILQRIFYILESVKPSFDCVLYSLQILTRLSRDSLELSNKIVQTEHLMTAIINHFIPTTTNFSMDPKYLYKGTPVLAALKLMRILSLQSKEVCEILISKYGLLKPISAYASSGVDSMYGLQLQIESFCILTNLVHYGLGTEMALSLCPLVITILHKHVQGTDIFIETSVVSATHAAVILRYVNKLLNCDLVNLDGYKHQIHPLLNEGAQKWLIQTTCLNNYTSGHLKLLSSVLDCCRSILTTDKITLNFFNDILKKLSLSKGFQCIIKNIPTSSNLLSEIGAKDINSIKNLKSLEATVIDSTQRVLPILNVTSPIALLISLFKLLNIINDKEITKLFIDKVLPYLQTIAKKSLSLNRNWFTQMEVDFVLSIVKVAIKSNLSETVKDNVYIVANKLCYILRIERQNDLLYLFNNVIFNKNLFTAERLFNLISLIEGEGTFTTATSVEEIKLCYSQLINKTQIESKSNLAIRKWQEAVLPRDWIYLPILSLYSSTQEFNSSTTLLGNGSNKIKQQQNAQKELIIRCCLEWILFNEITCPDLLNDIDVTDRFCRIMCVFLCDSSLFLDKKINMLLCKYVQLLFKNCQKFNFDKQLTGLSNFQDFYTQCLEQFQSVSYGDHIFASCVLVPLAQKHNIKWRKLLWSEYAGCLRALDCPENYLCYHLDEYYYPEETDESLLRSYSRALSSNLIRPNTIAYKIARHHVEHFKKRTLVKQI